MGRSVIPGSVLAQHEWSPVPGWFSGAEAILESYVTTVSQVQRLEAARRKAKEGTGDRYQKLVRMHRQSVALAASLATRLRLTPSSRIDKRTPVDGIEPIGGRA